MQESLNDKIDAYLLGRLQGEELAEFEARLQSDPGLAKEVQLQKTLKEQVESMGALQMKDQLLEIKGRLQKRRRTMIRRMLGLTAAAAVALVFFFVQGTSTESPQEHFQKYYRAYDLPFTSRGTPEELQLNEAGTYYRQGNYQAALPILEQWLMKNPQDSRTRLAIGICQMESEQYEAALSAFAWLIQNEDALYLDQARWYTALIHLKAGRIEDCRKQLILLTGNPRAFHYQQAQELLKEL